MYILLLFFWANPVWQQASCCLALMYHVCWFGDKYCFEMMRGAASKIVSMRCWNQLGCCVFSQVVQMRRYFASATRMAVFTQGRRWSQRDQVFLNMVVLSCFQVEEIRSRRCKEGGGGRGDQHLGARTLRSLLAWDGVFCEWSKFNPAVVATIVTWNDWKILFIRQFFHPCMTFGSFTHPSIGIDGWIDCVHWSRHPYLHVWIASNVYWTRSISISISTCLDKICCGAWAAQNSWISIDLHWP